MFKNLKKSLIFFVMVALTLTLSSCATTGGTTPGAPSITPLQAYGLAKAVGEFGWQFTSIDPSSQTIINGFCVLQSTITTTTSVAQVTQEFQTALQNLWVAASAISNPQAMALVDAINALWGMVGNSPNIAAQYVFDVVKGICDGISAAQGKSITPPASIVIIPPPINPIEAFFININHSIESIFK